MDDREGARDLRRLKAIGLVAPVVFLLTFEAFRALVVETAFPGPTSNVVAATLGVAAATLFGLVLFFHIERAQRQIVRQNRDLGIVKAVSVAIQGETAVDAVVDAALAEIIEATGAAVATVTIHPLPEEGGPGREIVRRGIEPPTDALATPDHPIDVSLSTGASPIGRLRLTVPAARVTSLPSPEAMHTVAHQLAASMEIGRLLADLGRRRDEGHVLYQCLLQISNQAPLPEILAAIVSGARERLGATEGRVCLSSGVLRAFEDDEAILGRLTAGIACELDEAGAPGSDVDPETAGHGHAPISPPGHRCDTWPASAPSIRVPIWVPGELLGDLAIARPDGAPFSERDRRYLATLGGITAIAIASARLRALERQGAILAERDRIARELHDSLAQVLGSTHLRLRMLLPKPDVTASPKVAEELESLAGVCEEAYRDVREAILGLREASRGRGLLEALEAYVEKFAQQSGIPTTLVAHVGDAVDGEPILTSSAEIQVIRVIQEALTNVRKHARASHAEVRVSDAPASGEAEPEGGAPVGALTIVVEDDGRGFDPSKARVHRDGGYGLETMRERMELAGGSLRIDSTQGRGTRIIAIVPQTQRSRPATVVERTRATEAV